jgi:hypothetical protein
MLTEEPWERLVKRQVFASAYCFDGGMPAGFPRGTPLSAQRTTFATSWALKDTSSLYFPFPVAGHLSLLLPTRAPSIAFGVNTGARTTWTSDMPGRRTTNDARFRTCRRVSLELFRAAWGRFRRRGGENRADEGTGGGGARERAPLHKQGWWCLPLLCSLLRGLLRGLLLCHLLCSLLLCSLLRH